MTDNLTSSFEFVLRMVDIKSQNDSKGANLAQKYIRPDSRQILDSAGLITPTDSSVRQNLLVLKLKVVDTGVTVVIMDRKVLFLGQGFPQIGRASCRERV